MDKTANRNVHFLRKQAGWTQQNLADRLGLKKSNIGSIEEFRSRVKIELANQLKELFHIDLDTLYNIDLEKNKKVSSADLSTKK